MTPSWLSFTLSIDIRSCLEQIQITLSLIWEKALWSTRGGSRCWLNYVLAWMRGLSTDGIAVVYCKRTMCILPQHSIIFSRQNAKDCGEAKIAIVAQNGRWRKWRRERNQGGNHWSNALHVPEYPGKEIFISIRNGSGLITFRWRAVLRRRWASAASIVIFFLSSLSLPQPLMAQCIPTQDNVEYIHWIYVRSSI